ncbi:hypothetical protein FB458_2060 [Lapillicoccus jejuensis]|uniref:Uncharacterized protein n=1 Tax=Lapillicoccus jejuensis TaxID=402171 RepID=A0A542E107_9MICO|nr:hypothetical protein FB458_2060 [Lapillicoccus jejuensis]
MTRLRALGALLVVLVVLGVGGAASTVAFNQLNGPEQAVLDYASLIADGRASAAARRVAPVSSEKGRVVPRLLSDAALARATRIRPLSAAVETGRPGGVDVPVGQSVTVDLTYAVGQRSGVAALRVRRDADGFPFTHRWTVVDPLLVPVDLRPNLPTLGPPTIAGVAIPFLTGTNPAAAADQGPGGTRTGSARPVLMYPGVYPLTTPDVPLLTAGVGDAPPTLVVVHAADAATRVTVLRHDFSWTASQDLLDLIGAGVVTQLTTCVTQGPGMSPTCPRRLYAVRNKPGLTSVVAPAELVVGNVSRDPDGYVHVPFRYSTPQTVAWTGTSPGKVAVPVSGDIAFLPSDDLAAPLLDRG